MRLLIKLIYRGKTHQADPIRTWIFPHVLRQISVGHPLRHNLQRFHRNANEGDDIRVPQPFPYNDLFEDQLQHRKVFFSSNKRNHTMSNANLLEGLVIVQVKPQRLYTDFSTTVDAFPHISKATTGDRAVTNPDEIAGYCV